MDYAASAKEYLSLLGDLRHLIRSFYIGEEFKGENIVLLYLFEHGGSVTPGQMSEVMDVTTSRITALMNSLEDKEYIVRTHSHEDRRKAIIALTDAGSAHIAETIDKITRRMTDVLEFLGEEDAEAYLRITKKLVRYEKAQTAPL